MSDFQTPIDALEFPRATLYTPAPGVENERASFGWSLFNGNPRITVWTRVDDKEKGPISAGIGHEALEAIFDQAEQIFGTPGLIDTIAADTMIPPKRDDGNEARQKVLGSTFYFGRGENGMCFFTLKSGDADRPEIVFEFRAFEWHPMRRKSKPYTEEEMSSIHALAIVRYLRKALFGNIKGQTREERRAQAEARKAAREARFGGNRSNGGNFNSTPKPARTGTPVEAGGFDENFAF